MSTKIMDFCGSIEMLISMLEYEIIQSELRKLASGTKVMVVIVAEDEEEKSPAVEQQQVTMQGNNLSVNVEGELHFGEHMEALDGRNEHYTPKFGPDADGWIEWRGGVCPLYSHVNVIARFRDGSTGGVRSSYNYLWDHTNNLKDIVAYKIISMPLDRGGDDEVVS